MTLNRRNIMYPISDENHHLEWHAYTCGFCDTKVNGAVVGIYADAKWVLCTHCSAGSVIQQGVLIPAAMFGPSILGLPKDIEAAYREVRKCMEANACNAAEQMCRKILMHIAVEKGADEGAPFESYLDYLKSAGYITATMEVWVDLIKKHGNKATHKLEGSDRVRAESTAMFTAQLLKIIYEMEHIASAFTKSPKT